MSVLSMTLKPSDGHPLGNVEYSLIAIMDVDRLDRLTP